MTEVPAHIDPSLVIDFDMFSVSDPEGDVQRAWADLHNGPPIFWTPLNGGHWVATRAEDIKTIQVDHKRFSMRENGIPRRRRGLPSPPIDLDPPAHFSYRKLLSPFFSPKAIKQIETSIRDTMEEIVGRVAPKGECEFMDEVAKYLPIVVFLRLLELPLEDRERLLEMSEAYASASAVEESNAARLVMRNYIVEWVERRRAHPSTDVLSELTKAEIDGRPITDEELFGMCTLLLSGGLDTVKSFLGFSARFLATHPDHLRQLVDQSDLIPNAIEELLRRHGIANTARLITHDFEYKGIQFREGEQILNPNLLFGLDAELHSNPLDVDFNRPKPIQHAAFGNGPHTCPGAMLARTELRIFFEYWLKALPAFRLKPGTVPVTRVGTTNSIRELWLVWDL